MRWVPAILVLLVATTAVADDSSRTDASPVSPAIRPSREQRPPEPEYRSRTRLQVSPPSETEINTEAYADWYERRFLWDPGAPGSLFDNGEIDCLSKVTAKRWVQRRRGGAYRYLRKRAVHYFKREYRRQAKRDWRKNPSFGFEDYEASQAAWGRGNLLHKLKDHPIRIAGIPGRTTPEVTPQEPYIARIGPLRIDDTYRLEVDLNDLWSSEAPEYDTVPGAASPARSLRKSPRRRWVDVKVSPRMNVRVGRGNDAADVLRSYGGRVKVTILPRRPEGPLFRSSVKVKMDLDGDVRITFNLLEKHF